METIVMILAGILIAVASSAITSSFGGNKVLKEIKCIEEKLLDKIQDIRIDMTMIDHLKEKIRNLERSNEKQWDRIDDLNGRLKGVEELTK